jgi:hypothetical protein
MGCCVFDRAVDLAEKVDKNGVRRYIFETGVPKSSNLLLRPSAERSQDMMPTHTPTDEQLKDQAIRQALAGDTGGARRSASGIADRRYLRETWQMMLFVESERGNVQAVKDTILSCPDPSLLASHFYLELPQVFVKAGDRSGAIEIAKAMGDAGVLPLIGIAAHLAEDGDLVGVQAALSQIDDEDLRAMILRKVRAYQPKTQRFDGVNLVEDQAAETNSLAA